MSKVSMLQDRIVLNFDWTAVAGEPFMTMARADHALKSAAHASQAKLESLAGDPNFTQQGRQNQVREWFRDDGLTALKQGREALLEARRAVERAYAEMKPRQPEKDDFAGAYRRGEIRQYLRSMDAAKRTALLSGAEDIDSEMALAITEALPELSGVTPEQRDRLVARSLAALYPKEGERIAQMQQAMEALESSVRASSSAMANATGYTPSDFDQMLGEPSIAEKIAARLGTA